MSIESSRPLAHVELPRCPYCRENVHPEETKLGCTACMAWHHQKCLRESGDRCSSCGHLETPAPVAAGVSVPPAAASVVEPPTPAVPSAALASSARPTTPPRVKLGSNAPSGVI